jgi:hypothetical protein
LPTAKCELRIVSFVVAAQSNDCGFGAWESLSAPG